MVEQLNSPAACPEATAPQTGAVAPRLRGRTPAWQRREAARRELLALDREFQAANPGLLPDSPRYFERFATAHWRFAREQGIGCDARSLRRLRERAARGEPLDQWCFRGERGGRRAPAVPLAELFDIQLFEAAAALQALRYDELTTRQACTRYRECQAEAARRGLIWCGTPRQFRTRFGRCVRALLRERGRLQ